MRNMKKGTKFVATALAFGVLASTAFQGSNYLYQQQRIQFRQFRYRKRWQCIRYRPGGDAVSGSDYQ